MQEKTLKNLILENEDYIFAGNLTIDGDVIIKNANLIVSGKLRFSNTNATISIIGSDISCEILESFANIYIRDGDIWVKYLDLSIAYPPLLSNIDSDGDIEVKRDSFVGNVSCLNYHVSGNNYSNDISAKEDIYILGTNDSNDIKGRDILIGGECNLNNHTLIAKAFSCKGPIINCGSMSTG